MISCVWIPAGQWRQEQKILSPDPTRGQYNQKGIRNAVIRGAGMWHTKLYTNTEPQNVQGNINHPHEGNVGFDIDDNTQISDLAIFGMTTNRANRGHGINGRLGKNTKITNVWIEHVNVGAWVGRDYSDTPAYWNPGDGLDFSGMRIRDTYADGINFANSTRNSRVFNSSFRTTATTRWRSGRAPTSRTRRPTSGTTTTSPTTRSRCPGGPTASRSTAATATPSRTTWCTTR